MALTPINNTDTDYISQLGDNPNVDDGLSAAQLKAVFDKNAEEIRYYLNNTLIPGIESGFASSPIGTDDIDSGAVTNTKLGGVTPYYVGFRWGTTEPTTSDISDGQVYFQVEE